MRRREGREREREREREKRERERKEGEKKDRENGQEIVCVNVRMKEFQSDIQSTTLARLTLQSKR